MIWREHDHSNQHVKFDADRRGQPVPGCAGQLKQVMFNLVRNPAQAISHKDGLITIRSYSAEGFVVLDVEDNGYGMTTMVKEKLFDATFTTKPEGSWIGLNCARSIIEKRHGRISVQSQPWFGSIFKISIPAFDQMEASGD